MSATCRVCFAVWLLAVGMVPAAWGQPAGIFAGAGRDAQGGVLPGVTVTVSGGTVAPRVVVTTEQGAYSVTGLPPGSYNVEFELAGFVQREAGGGLVEQQNDDRCPGQQEG